MNIHLIMYFQFIHFYIAAPFNVIITLYLTLYLISYNHKLTDCISVIKFYNHFLIAQVTVLRILRF